MSVENPLSLDFNNREDNLPVFYDRWLLLLGAAAGGDPCGGRVACGGDPCGGRVACGGDPGDAEGTRPYENAESFIRVLGAIPPVDSCVENLVGARERTLREFA